MGAACRSPPLMPADSASAPSPQPLDGLSPSQRALLRIVCWVAWADGDFAAEERELLDKLVQRLLPAEAGAGAAASASASALATEPPTAAELALLVAALEGSDQRQLAVKLALQMVSVNQRPGDAAAINPAEKGAYRQLLEALALPESEVEEAEWAARQELEQPRSLLELIGAALSGFGAWPALDDGQLPPGYWL
jgi:hypothetical protein